LWTSMPSRCLVQDRRTAVSPFRSLPELHPHEAMGVAVSLSRSGPDDCSGPCCCCWCCCCYIMLHNVT
jgi:hypothetical protein